MLTYLMRFNVRLRRACPNKMFTVSVFHLIHLSLNNSINPVKTDINQSVLTDIRLSLGLPKMIAKI